MTIQNKCRIISQETAIQGKKLTQQEGRSMGELGGHTQTESGHENWPKE